MAQGKFYDFGWHNEYHSSPKKDQPVDCIYLANDRECTLKECYYFGSKCFDSSHCPHKVREKDKDKIKNKPQKVVYEEPETLRLDLHLGQVITHVNFGMGIIVKINDASGTFSLLMTTAEIKQFNNPKSFELGKLLLP